MNKLLMFAVLLSAAPSGAATVRPLLFNVPAGNAPATVRLLSPTWRPAYTRSLHPLPASVQRLLPRISPDAVTSRFDSAYVLAPRDATDSKAKVALVYEENGSGTYRIRTMGQLNKAYAKSIADGADPQRPSAWFESLFDAAPESRLPVARRQGRDIPLGPGTRMRPDDWRATRARILALGE